MPVTFSVQFSSQLGQFSQIRPLVTVDSCSTNRTTQQKHHTCKCMCLMQPTRRDGEDNDWTSGDSTTWLVSDAAAVASAFASEGVAFSLAALPFLTSSRTVHANGDSDFVCTVIRIDLRFSRACPGLRVKTLLSCLGRLGSKKILLS